MLVAPKYSNFCFYFVEGGYPYVLPQGAGINTSCAIRSGS